MESNKKTLIISIVFGLIILVLICFVIFPLFNGIKKNSEDFTVVKKDLILFQSETENIEGIKKTYDGLKKDLEKIEELFIDPEIPIDLIKFWEKIALDSEVLISIFPISLKTAEDEIWNSMGFQITITGSFPNFLEFLEKTENCSYLIEIQNLTVRKSTKRELKSEENEQFSLINATLLTKVYTK